MNRARRLIKPLLSALIVLCTGYFFFRAFRRNWAEVSAHEFHIAPLFLMGAVLAAVATCLLGTCGWYTAMNSLSRGRAKIDFRHSVATVNASGLTKYIPGKIWSYALQMYWLDGLGFSKALIVYVNLINLLISLGTSLILGLVCLLFAQGSFPLAPVAGALLGLLVLDAAAVVFNHALLNGLILLINRILKRKFSYFEVRQALLIKLHLIHFGAGVCSGVSAFLFSFAIGYRIDFAGALLVIGSSLVADVVGFLAIIVPGGLGVRETLMYELLGGAHGGAGSLSLVLPVASRMMNMFVDIALGAVALRLLRSLAAVKRVQA
ncbi:MAG: lysylphosphatidylglycerol synthase domain-containing protein [Pseudomonadota bacterium]